MRIVGDGPLKVEELAKVPVLNLALFKLCLSSSVLAKKVLLTDSITIMST